jgi:polyphenol oxidase
VRGVLRIDRLASMPGLLHGFSTVAAGPMQRGPDDPPLTGPRRAFAAEVGVDPDRLCGVGGIHGVGIRRVEEPSGTVEGVDGLVTSRPRLPLFAIFADCRPIILYDPERRALGLFHAGWRGAAAGMASLAVASLRREFGCRSEDLVAGIGPGICGACNEVGPEVAERFPEVAVTPGRGDRLLLDLELVNRLQLEASGVDPARIFCHPACTVESEELPSHRARADGSRFACLVALW